MPMIEHLSNPEQGRYGKVVKIIKGGYTENDGAWIDLQRGESGYTKKMVYVMILEEDGTLLSTALLQGSITFPNPSPTNLEEAILEEHDDIHRKMEDLAVLMARCRLSNSQTRTMSQIFEMKIIEAKRRLEAKKDRWYIHTEWACMDPDL